LAPSAQRTLDYNLIEQITNRLAMYVWNGQSNAVVSAAPWISESSINQNVMIGGGGDQIWFHIQYATPVYKTGLNFKETGLPVGDTWSVSAGTPPVGASNTTTTKGGALSILEPNGSTTFTVTAPSGYGLALVSGPHGTTYNTVTVSGSSKGTAVTLKFGALESAVFTESGLPSGTNWSVTLTPATTAGAPGATASSTGTTITFTGLPVGAHFKYQVGKPSTYKASGGKGSFGIGVAGFSKTVKFTAYTANIVFAAHGLPHAQSWTVYVNGTDTALVLTSTLGTQKVALFNGSYTWTAVKAGTFTPSVGTGLITVVAPHGQTVAITYAAGHAQDPNQVSHANLIAAPTSRD